MKVDRPVVFLGMLHTQATAMILHLLSNLARLYIGHGVLKPFRHIWYMNLAGACISIAGLSCNLIHETKIWEWHLLIGSQTGSIPRLMKFTIETHYLFIAMYMVTGMYVYFHKPYFWGRRDV
jgi:hypothetical protein